MYIATSYISSFCQRQTSIKVFVFQYLQIWQFNLMSLFCFIVRQFTKGNSKIKEFLLVPNKFPAPFNQFNIKKNF